VGGTSAVLPLAVADQHKAHHECPHEHPQGMSPRQPYDRLQQPCHLHGTKQQLVTPHDFFFTGERRIGFLFVFGWFAPKRNVEEKQTQQQRKMRLVIRSEGKAAEWNLIEMQGELFVPEGTYDGKEIGKLSERDGVRKTR